MRVAYIILFVTLTITSAKAQPFEISLHQRHRQFRNTCTIKLREPVTNKELGTYECITGGAKRGSAPLGNYVIGAFRRDGSVGPRWELRQDVPGTEDGSAWDIDLNDWRTELQLHTLGTNGTFTYGCIGVVGGKEIWEEFQANIRYLIAWLGVVRFTLQGNPEGQYDVAASRASLR